MAVLLELLERLEILLEIVDVVRVIVDVASLEEPVEFEAWELQ